MARGGHGRATYGRGAYDTGAYGRRRRGGGCLGCLGVLALLVAIAVALTLYVVPPAVRNVAKSYAHSVLDKFGVEVSGTRLDEGALGYAGSHLSEAEQAAYLQLYAGFTAFEEDFGVEGATVDDVDAAFKAMMNDHPELFWLDGSCSYSYTALANVVTVSPGYSVPIEEVSAIGDKIEAEADAFLASLAADASQYEIARAAYAYVIESTDYALDAEQSQNIQSVFLNHSSVCAGYSRAYMYLLQRAGLFCAYVEGTMTEPAEDHAWNLVCIDGQYAYVDTTWGDPTYANSNDSVRETSVIYDYFCLTTEEVLRDGHAFSNADLWPACESAELDWYRREGLMFESADDPGLADAFWRQADQGNMAAFKFSNEEAYQAVVARLQDGSFMRDQLLGIAEGRGESRMGYSYTQSDSLRIVKLFW